VARLQAFAEKRVGEILDEALERGRVDFVSDVAGRLPTALIAELVGVPEADRQPLYEIANRVMAFSDPEYSEATGGANMEAIEEMLAFAADLAGRRRRAPREDLMSELLQAEIDGDRLCDEEIEYFFLLLITAGIETTRSAISAGVLAFHDAPEEWRRLRSRDVSMKTAVEEIVRYTAPIHHFRRTTHRNVRIADREIEAGSRVVIWYSSANRDERVFRQPQRFDAGRTPNEHLSFGFGRHFCLGASLARMEIGAMLQGLLERDVRVERRGEVEWMASNFAQSPKRMPVALSRRSG
jgi:cytochrome P450